jgi:hypothetical protein
LKWIEKEEEIKVISRRNPAVRSDSLLSVSHTQRAGTDGYGMQEAERRMDFTDSLIRSPKTAAHHPRALGQLGKRSRECFFCLERPRPSSLSLSLSFNFSRH